MLDQSRNTSIESSQPSNAGSSLDLLREGSTMNLKSSSDSALAHIAPLEIDMGTPKVAEATDVPASTTAGGMVKESRSNVQVNAKPPVVIDHDTVAAKKPEVALPKVEIPYAADITSTLSRFAVSGEFLQRSDVREAADSIFDRVDEDRNGFLDQGEIGKAIENSLYSGQEVQVIDALYKNVDMLSKLSRDGRFDFLGISRNDMAKLDSIFDRHDHVLDSMGYGAGWAKDRFKNFDTDKSNSLSVDEVDTGLTSKTLDTTDQKMLTYLKENFGEVAVAHDDGEWFLQTKEIRPADLITHELNVMHEAAEAFAPLAGWIYRASQMQRPEISRSLFADKNNPELTVTPDAISQGQAGDSSFLASVAALAKSDPKAIVQMIDSNPDGTYTVTFPGDARHPVTVDAPTTAELGMFNGGSSSGIWASVLEKSYAKYLETNHGNQGSTHIEAARQGGRPIDPDALKLLTGRNDFKWENLSSFSEQSLTSMLLENFEDGHGKPIIVATERNSLFDDIMSGPTTKTTEDGFIPDNGYTVTGIDPDGNGGYMVTVRNPWGQGANSPLGTIKISIDQFQKNFKDIIYWK